MSNRFYLDVETIGLNGPCRLVQYQIPGQPIKMIKLFKGKESEYAGLLAELVGVLDNPDYVCVGFNVGFDLYHIYRLLGRSDPFRCGVVDLLVHAQMHGPFAPYAFIKKGKRGVTLSKVPAQVASLVSARVERELLPLLPAHGTLVCHHHEVKGRKDLVTLSWEVKVSLGLKAHMKHYGEPVRELKQIWPIPPKKLAKNKPFEDLHLPYADERYEPFEPAVEAILADDNHEFFKYAHDDIRFTEILDSKFGFPAPTHHDTTVACVAFTRYYGIPLDRQALAEARYECEKRIKEAAELLAGCDLKSPKQRLALLRKYDPFIASSKKEVLEKLVNLETLAPETRATAKAMLNYGKYTQRLNQIIKAGESKTGRLHIDLKCLGTPTGRKAGAGGFNAQGVAKPEEEEGQKVPNLRSAILAAMVGDFWSFEVCLAAAAWDEKQLKQDLTNKVDLHMMVAVSAHPHMPKGTTYEEAIAKKSTEPYKTLRAKCKPVLFGIFYGCEAEKCGKTLGVSAAEGQTVMDRIFLRYPRVKAVRAQVTAEVCTGDTEKWTRDSVAKMRAQTTDMTGHTRYWAFEKALAQTFWLLANKSWEELPAGVIVRQEAKGQQTIKMAVRSALLGAALGVQKMVARQMVNNDIQAPGANLCKMLEARLWEKFHCPMVNVHDEIVFLAHPNTLDNKARIYEEVAAFVSEKRPQVPHLKFELANTTRWSDK